MPKKSFESLEDESLTEKSKEKKVCPECGLEMEGGACSECGYDSGLELGEEGDREFGEKGFEVEE